MTIIIITILLIIYVALAIKKLNWALYFIPLLLPTYLIRFMVGPIPFTFVESLIIIFVAAWFVKKLQKRELIEYIRSLSKNKFVFPALLLLLAATISIYSSADFISALGIWKAYFVVPIVFYLAFIDTVKTKKQIKNIILGLGLSAFAVSLYAIIQYFIGWGIPVTYSFEGLRRATSIYGYPAALGLFVAPIFTMIAGIFILSLGRKKEDRIFQKNWIIVLTLVVIGLALIFSRTEGAWIAVLTAIFFILMFTKYRWDVIALSLIGIIIIFTVPATRDYVLPLITFQDVSGDVRLTIWQGTVRLIQNHPVFGAGLAGFQTLYAQYKEAKHVEISLYPHNIFLNFWVETGALGLIAMMFLIFQYIKKGFTGLNKEGCKLHDSSYKITLLSVMVCILVYGLVDVPYFKNDLAILFWIWLGLMNIKNINIITNK